MNTFDTTYPITFLPTLSGYVLNQLEESEAQYSELIRYQNNIASPDNAVIASIVVSAKGLPLLINQYQEHVDQWQHRAHTESQKLALQALEASISRLRQVNIDILVTASDLSKKAR